MSRLAALLFGAPLLGALLGGSAASRAATPVPHIVAAENFYADVAGQIAGPQAQVSSILSNPDQDPHLYEASPAVARALARATITISNGVDYDPWMATLLAASPSAGRRDIVVAQLVGARAGSNPHLWYDPATMKIFARFFAKALDAAEPDRKAAHAANRERFLASLAPINARIAQIRGRFGGTEVTATEPVFGLMSNALGFVMRDTRFQLAVMNDTEPRPSDVASFENDLRGHRVRLFFYNSQATDGAARRLLAIATQSGVPVVGVTETEPRGKDYQHWLLGELDAVDRALSGGPS
jgi:zinc/manganese transport system substrate-binding protein